MLAKSTGRFAPPMHQFGHLKKSTLFTLLGVLVACLSALCVAGPIFRFLDENPRSDIHNYVNLFDRYSAYLEANTDGLLSYIVSEIHFHFWYEQLSYFLGSPVKALQVLSFIATAAILLGSFDGTFRKLLFSVAIMSHPRVLDMLGSQQRMALALAALIPALNIQSRLLRYPLFALAISFHTYAIVLVAAFEFFTLVEKLKSTRLRYAINIAACTVIVLGSVVLQRAALQQLGATDRIGFAANAGLAYAVMWVATATAVFFASPRFLLSPYGALFLLMIASATTAAAVGVYGERYYALAPVFLAASSYRAAPSYGIVFGTAFLGNLALSYYFWLWP